MGLTKLRKREMEPLEKEGRLLAKELKKLRRRKKKR